jgi:solute carrier family 25 phosphate transporter 23/24/25/41
MQYRDFLLFIPSTEPGLKEVLSYFSASLKVNPEGDVMISDGTIQSLGIILRFLSPLFETFTSALVSIYEPPHRTERHHGFSTDQALDADFFWQEDVMADEPDNTRPQPVPKNGKAKEGSLLIAIIPHPGYFVAVCQI